MDLIKIMQSYVQKMVSDSGMKILLLDNDTTGYVSVTVTQTQLLTKEVYLVDRIDKQREKMKHLKCVCFLRPSTESLQHMVEELRDPKYGEYNLYFSNILKKSQIERLAEVDEYQVVKQVQEFYGDYIAVHDDFFTLNLTYPNNPIYGDNSQTWNASAFQKTVEGLVALLLSLKKRPLIRYEKNSSMAKRLASEINYQIQHEAQLFDFRRPDAPPILLILDRRNDPVTPLLNQWTYEAMVHELLGINNGRVDMSHVQGIQPELKEIVLSSNQDAFYKKNMFLNMGDMGANIKTYVDEYQVKTRSNMKIESIAEMKRFVEEYPEFRKLSGNVSKHVALISELSRLVEKNGLLEVGELEQSLACFDSHSQDFKVLSEQVKNPKIPVENKIRLIILYGLRYERVSNNLDQLLSSLTTFVDSEKIRLIQNFLKYCSSDKRQGDLFSNESILSKGKNVFRGLKGAENVYTQHTPAFAQVIEDLIKGKMKDMYPFVDGSTTLKAQEIIVFIIGGVTYVEAKAINSLQSANVKIVLGGTCIHSSASFLKEIYEASSKWS